MRCRERPSEGPAMGDGGVHSPDTLARYNKMAAAAQSRLRTRHDITEEQKLRQVRKEVVLTGFFVAD